MFNSAKEIADVIGEALYSVYMEHSTASSPSIAKSLVYHTDSEIKDTHSAISILGKNGESFQILILKTT